MEELEVETKCRAQVIRRGEIDRSTGNCKKEGGARNRTGCGCAEDSAIAVLRAAAAISANT